MKGNMTNDNWEEQAIKKGKCPYCGSRLKVSSVADHANDETYSFAHCPECGWEGE
jgi:formate dehydrogenase maturation protein FdhE